ncbi:fibronectin type III domain-containing protein [bacterium]|nr:fibronectin type III domain-containing protein [bacterium]
MTGASAEIRWLPVEGVDGYGLEVYESGEITPVASHLNISATATSQVVGGLLPGRVYLARLFASYAVGDSPDAWVSFTTALDLLQPGVLDALILGTEWNPEGLVNPVELFDQSPADLNADGRVDERDVFLLWGR